MSTDGPNTPAGGWAEPPTAAPAPGAAGQPPPAAASEPVDLDRLAGGRVIRLKGPIGYLVVGLLITIVVVLWVVISILSWY